MKQLSRREFLQITGLATGAIVVTACAPVGVPTASESASAGGAASQAITIAVPEELADLDAGDGGNLSQLGMIRNTYEALVSRDPATGELIPELATEWSQPDANTWRFKLREGVKFHDGTDFNADAAVWAVNYMFDEKENKSVSAGRTGKVKAEVVDANTIDLKTPDPDPILPRQMFFIPIPSPKSIQDDTERAYRTMVGTGPYVFKEWLQGDKLVLTANPDYWAYPYPQVGKRGSIHS